MAASAALLAVAGALALGTGVLAQSGSLALTWASVGGGGGGGMTGGAYTLGGAVGGTGWGTASGGTTGGGAYELRAGFWGGITVGPILATNAGLIVAEGAAATLTSAHLRVADDATTTDRVTFILAAAPARGTLRVGTTPLAGGGTFTQADLDAGRVTYAHDGSETTSDGFAFTVADGAGGSIGPTTFAIVVAPTNDAPAGIALSGAAVFENSPSGTVVGHLSTADPDPGDTHTYALADDAGGRFTVSGTELRVLNGAALDYEAARIHQVAVRSTDAGGRLTIAGFTIQVIDVDESACAQRPRIDVQVAQVGPGTFRATLVPGTSARLPSNPIASISVATGANATLDIGPGLVHEHPSGVQGGSGTLVVHPTNGAQPLPITVTRRGAGPFLVEVVLHDACGPWPTFVGGGRNVR